MYPLDVCTNYMYIYYVAKATRLLYNVCGQNSYFSEIPCSKLRILRSIWAEI